MTQPPPYPGTGPLTPPPDGYGPPPGYGLAAERSGPLVPVIMTVAVIWAVIQWLMVSTAPSAVQAYQHAIASGTPADQIFTSYDFLGVPSALVGILAFVLTGIWLSQARRNADRIAPALQRRSKSWVWLGWWFPIVSFWFPKQIIDDVWRGTVRSPGEPDTGWWWGSWIAAQLLGSLSAQVFSFTGEPREAILDNLVIIELLTALATTAAMVGWIRVVRTISQAQDALANGGPPPERMQLGG